MIQEDLEREPTYIIVKARALGLLQLLSEFEALKNDTAAQETLINGVIALYASQEKIQSPDMFLQMKCIDYMKNFYHDYQFRVNKYAHLLPRILPICKDLILKYLTRE